MMGSLAVGRHLRAFFLLLALAVCISCRAAASEQRPVRFKRCRHPGLLIHLTQKTKRRRIGLVDPDRLLQKAACLLILPLMNIKK